MQAHYPSPSEPAAAAAGPSSSSSVCAARRPVRRLLLLLAGELPHGARSQASRARPAAAADKEETRPPAIAAAGSRSCWVGGGARVRGRGWMLLKEEAMEVGEEGERKGEVNRSEVKEMPEWR